MLKKILVSLIVLIVVVLVALYFTRNVLAKKAVEEGSSYALGVETDLGSANVSISGGSFEMDDYKIANPEGFQTKNFFVLKRGMLDVDAGSVLDDEVKVDSLILEGATVTLEVIDGKANFKALLDHLNGLNLGSSEKSEKKFLIENLVMRDINAEASLTLMGKKQFDKSFGIDNIMLKNVGGDNGATIAEITSTVIKTLIKRATASGKGILPDGFGIDIGKIKQDVGQQVEDEAKKQLQDLGGSLLKKGGK